MKLTYQYMAIFFNKFQTTSNHLHPLQVENCDSNSRLVVDEGTMVNSGLKGLISNFLYENCNCEIICILVYHVLYQLHVCTDFPFYLVFPHLLDCFAMETTVTLCIHVIALDIQIKLLVLSTWFNILHNQINILIHYYSHIDGLQ